MDFIGREEELSILRTMYKMPSLKGAIVYGRRRMGKTSLLLKSSKDFDGRCVYYQCLDATDSENANQLYAVAKMALPEISIFGSFSFVDVLSAIFECSKKEPLLLILDEYPYLNNRNMIDSFIQGLMEKYKECNFKIVLAGSYINVMEHLLDEEHPLHGRFIYKILIEPFDYYDSAKFYPNVSNEDKVCYYSIFGGNPYYLSMLNHSFTFEKNVKNLLLDKFAPLESEINTTLREEYSKVTNASFVMSLIMRGKHSYSDINKSFKMQVANSDLNYILKFLIDMKFINKTYAINDKKEVSAYYSIEDNLYAFFYQIISPTLSMKPIMSVNAYFNKFIKEKMYKDFIPHRFEKVAKEFLIRQNKEGRINPLFTAIGSYTYNDSKRHKNGQFDVVTEDDNGNTFFECKFTKEKINDEVYQEEVRQIKDAGVPYYRLGFFSKSGYDLKKNDRDLYFTLDDLYD